MKFWYICLILLIPLVVLSQIYYWEDENGVKHYSSTPPSKKDTVHDYQEYQITPSEQQKQEKKVLNQENSKKETERVAVREKGFPKIIMYSTSWCGYCKKAKKFFEENGIAYTEYDVEKSAEKMAEFKRLGGTGVPFIIVGNKRMRGFSEDNMKKLLGMN